MKTSERLQYLTILVYTQNQAMHGYSLLPNVPKDEPSLSDGTVEGREARQKAGENNS